MIGFFRKIRRKLADDNQFVKYSRYVIGEILLVMIGILLALQVNNWNEDRITKKIEKEQLINLVEDLKLDSLHFDGTLIRINNISALYKEIHAIGIKGSSETLSENPDMIRWGFGLYPPSKKNATILINELKNKTLRNQIIKYLDSSEFTARITHEFHSIVKSKFRPFLGQQRMYNVSEMLDSQSNMISSDDLIELSKNEDFQQLFFEAYIKLSGSKRWLPILIDNNNLLIENIKSELKKY
jgi:hypothetical protein